MSHIVSFKRSLVGLAFVGALTGAMLALSAGPALAAKGCACVITGSGSYTCSTPSSCGAGAYTCTVSCQ
jgi:hypothetical protein